MSPKLTTSMQPDEPSQASTSFSYLLRNPWLLVSALLHLLLLALASLITFSIANSTTEDFCVTCEIAIGTIGADRHAGESVIVVDAPAIPVTPPVDAGLETSDIVVPPDIASKMDGDHWETIDAGASDVFVSTSNMDSYSGTNTNDPVVKSGGGLNDESLSIDKLGVGGASPGTGGGWGGGANDSAGTDTGGFSHRSSARYRTNIRKICCCSCRALSDTAVDAGLRWLAGHQDADGHWDTVKFGSSQKTDTAMTAMALLAFAGAGYTERVGKYTDNIKRAVAWLERHQHDNGLIFDVTDAGNHRGLGYPHAIATLALTEAAGMSKNKETQATAQRALDYATDVHQQGQGSDKLGWRYAASQAGDLSVTGWYVMALKSAKIAGLKVHESALEGAMKFLDSVEIKDGAVSRFSYQPGIEHPKTDYLLTAIGTLARRFCGRSADEAKASVDWFIEKGGVPSWGANGEKVDLYYWYYGSLCAFQQGGDTFKRFYHEMVQSLGKNQCKSGDDAGSWPVVGAYSDEWGRVGQTALSMLCLEAYYRYEKLKN